MVSGSRIHPSNAPTSEPSDRKSTRLNSSHSSISYAVFCLKKKNKIRKVDGAVGQVPEHQPGRCQRTTASRHPLRCLLGRVTHLLVDVAKHDRKEDPFAVTN